MEVTGEDSRRGLWGHVPQVQRGEGLPECTSGVTKKAVCPPPVAVSPCPISTTAGLVSSSTQPCSAQDQVLLIWASQQNHQRADSRTTHPASQGSGTAPTGASGELSAPFPCTSALSTKYPAQPGFLGTHTGTGGRGVQQTTSLAPGKCPAATALAAACTPK